MTDRLRRGLTVFMLVILAASAFAAGFLARELVDGRNNATLAYAEPDEETALFQEAWALIEGNFLGTLPESRQVTYGAIRGSLATLNDPYTVFIEPAARDVERERLQGSFGGIGAYITRAEETGEVTLEPIPGNPAEAAGILAGDVLLAVDGRAITAAMTVPGIVDLVKGEKGTTVTLTVRHPDATEPVDIGVVRADILLPSVAYRLLEADPTIGYIALSRFSGESGNEVGAALQDLLAQGATRLVLDLRQNGGGLRDAAVDVADHFLDGGPVLYLESQEEGEIVYNATDETLAPDQPLVVLIDGGTASASEIVAGALSDRQRATLIGSKSFGKGSVQLVFDLSDGSSVHVTSARWLTPNHRTLDGNGLEPDIPVTTTQEDIDNGRDPVLDRAVQYLQEVAP
ncbi:MAG: S41 family peptidase [Candidatus Promineofilum sp.]|nr:S41 family peptidase [Promineifilum sp.]MCW5861649.1 S41 family peptidase [Anaerolineae bacterium]